MILVPLVYLAIVIFMCYRMPMAGLVMGACAFLVGAIYQGAGFEKWIGVAAPFTAFCIIGLKAYKLKVIRTWSVGPLDLLLMSLFFIFLFSATYSDYQVASALYALRYLFLGASFFFAASLAVPMYQAGGDAVADYLKGAYIAGLVFSLIALLMHSSASQYYMRLTLGDVSAIPLAITLGQALIANVFLLMTYRSSILTFWLLGTFSIIGLAFLETNTRSVIIGFVAAILVLAISYGTRITVRTAVKALVLVLAAMVGVIYVVVSSPDLLDRMTHGFGRLASGSLGQSESDRLAAWSNVWGEFSNHPIMGMGAGSFEVKYGLYPHSSLFEVAAQNGLLGLIPFMLVYALCFARMIRVAKGGSGVVAAIFAFHLIVSMVSLSFWMNKFLFISIAMLFVPLKYGCKNRSTDNN